jgi:predicted metal-dependent hydrolase
MNKPTVRHPITGNTGPTCSEWLGRDALRSQFFNSLSMLFPVGEKYFIESLVRVIGRVHNAELSGCIRAFIGQESSHAKAHSQFNDRLEALGLPNVAERFVQWRLDRSGMLSHLDHLAITAAVEHFTSALGEGLLANDHWLEGASEEMQQLWKWHAAEEVEHGWIPLTTSNEIGGGYFRRMFWFLYVLVTLWLDVTIQTIANLYLTGRLFSARTWRKGLVFLFGRKGPAICAMCAIPSYLRIRYAPPRPELGSPSRVWLNSNAQLFRTNSAARGE